MRCLSLLRLFAFLTALCVPVAGFALDTLARAALVVDLGSGTVLLEKNAQTPLPPASMSKLMTLNMLFEALEDGRVGMDTEFRTSARAAAMGGSKMFLRDGERVSVRDLIQGVIVQSGNDACVVIAEGLSGTEDFFAEQMTTRAKALGMTASTFANSSGWPHPGQRMSAEDLVVLASRLITKFPQYYGYFSQQSFTWDGITQNNRNPLLSLGIGADGLKTGHTTEAGFGLVGSAMQGTRRVVFMITGLSSQKERSEESERLVNWAFRQFTQKKIFEAQTEIARADVWMGSAPAVGLVLEKSISLLLPVAPAEPMTAVATYIEPVEAPIEKGQVVGQLRVTVPGYAQVTLPLLAAEAVEHGGLMARFSTSWAILKMRAFGGVAN